MKDKRFKYYENIIEEYLQLTDEQIEIPLLTEKFKEKLDSILIEKHGTTLKTGDADAAYKIFLQLHKLETRKSEIETELSEVQNTLQQFLQHLEGCKISYQKRDDEDKSKTTYLFWLEEGQIKSNR